MHKITKEEVMETLGRDKTTITDELIDNINNVILDCEEEQGNLIKENFLTYSRVLSTGKFTINSYLKAVTFVSYKVMGMRNIQAYQHTYPDRYDSLKTRIMTIGGKNKKEFEKILSSYVHSVANNKLVTTILSQVQIPTKILNMGLLQEAINVEADLMYSSKSDIVKEKAANTLIQFLGSSDDTKIQADVGAKKDAIIDQYESAMAKMAEKQLELIKGGADVKEITNAEIVEVEVEDV